MARARTPIALVRVHHANHYTTKASRLSSATYYACGDCGHNKTMNNNQIYKKMLVIVK